MAGKHHFASHLVWTGGAQGPTSSSEAYSRDYRAQVEGKPPLDGSAHPAFRGDASRYNPEDLLVAALSGCPAPFDRGVQPCPTCGTTTAIASVGG